MLFFWASLNFTAYKTQPHGAHPTHGEIKAPLLHWKPMVTRQRLRKLRSGFASTHPEVQAHLFSSSPTQTSTHIQAVPVRPLPWIKPEESSERERRTREKASPLHRALPLSHPTASGLFRTREFAQCLCWTVSQPGCLNVP